MGLHLYNTLTAQKQEIVPLASGEVTMYSCGPTVYRPVHVGNLRSFLLSDFIHRTLAYHGFKVRKLMNITDVGHMTDELTEEGRDRMLLAADDEGLTTSEIAAKYTQAFLDDITAVNIVPADLYPRATEHIPQIIELIAKLLERGHAYEIEGNVYYDVTTFPGYGRLSHQALEDMRAGHRHDTIDERKRNHQDFSMWVAAGPRRELVYDSPWGSGYPGWHIECSAMSLHYFGERFDIHTGGIDNRFPHHEDEIAQSEGAVGHEVVGTWAHGEHLLMAQAKMAKSAGNVVTISTLMDQGYDTIAFRYLCFTARYRRQVHFTDEALAAAATALRRLREQVAALGADGAAASTDEALRSVVTDATALSAHDRFVHALDDDLDLPQALRVLHELIGNDTVAPHVRRTLIASWDNVLGLHLAGADDLSDELRALIAEREAARKARDYARSDAIRDRVRNEGIDLLDSASGTTWTRRRVT